MFMFFFDLLINAIISSSFRIKSRWFMELVIKGVSIKDEALFMFE